MIEAVLDQMMDNRTLREIVISRIEAYVRVIEYYNESEAQTAFNFDSMTDNQLTKAFEKVLWDSQKIKHDYREKNLDEWRRRWTHR